ncbi:Heat shock protein 12B [Sphaceloma murrayae]|uniref:Heat shock protein 12B n=1 Tax=Sphaceloma murrayae TaxID=2082308 RepID=A0A2K1QP60_9PEZI|nr:Heat shock protein 12B [Sphaceloma murrayae]
MPSPQAARRNPPRNRNGDKIIIAVDFGTTFTGVAMLYTRDGKNPDKIEVLKDDWPACPSGASEKVPTELVYADDMTIKHWGFEVMIGEDRIRCVKLKLDKKKDLPEFVDAEQLEELLSDLQKTPVTVTADFLRKIREAAMDHLQKRFMQETLDNVEIIWVVTVPAIWSEEAKNNTKLAAAEAEMGLNLKLVAEPEAAAVYTLSSMAGMSAKVGDVFTICDAGGGTIDLITYRVDKLRPPQFREVVPGTGGIGGGALIDHAFMVYLRDHLGREYFDQISRENPRAWSIAIEFFRDNVKRRFNPYSGSCEDTTFQIPVPGIPNHAAAKISDGYLNLSGADLASFFERSIVTTLGLLDEQIHATEVAGFDIAAVLLVGGLGQSAYLRRRIQIHLSGPANVDPTLLRNQDQNATMHSVSGKSRSHIQVIQPVNAWSAIARGATLQGFPGIDSVASRKARHHYGVVFDDVFNPSKHPESCKKWDGFAETWRAADQMYWLINKGDTIKTGAVVRNPYERYWFYDDVVDEISEKLYICEDDEAPTKLNDRVKHLVTVSVDSPERVIPPRAFIKERTSAGEPFKKLTYDVGLMQQSGQLTFDFRLKNTVLGMAKVQFE